MNASEVLKLFADPAMIKILEFADLTTGILITLMLGMGVTFIVLFILQLTTIGLSRVLAFDVAPDKPVEQSTPASSSDDELAAVITSAVAAVMRKSTGEIVIKSVKQV